MRKLLIAAIAVLTSIALATVAVAQNSTGASVTSNVSPTKAGTKSKPKGSTLTLSAKTNRNDATATKLAITLPKNAKVSGKGFPTCSATRLNSQGPDSCPAGSRVQPVGGPKNGPVGEANAVYGPDKVPTKFTVHVFISGKSSLVFYVQGLVKKALNASITKSGGRQKLTITIPPDLQQPGPNLWAGLVDISAKLKAKRGKNNLIVTNGCPSNKKHKTDVTFAFERPDPANTQYPGTGTTSGSDTSPCKK